MGKPKRKLTPNRKLKILEKMFKEAEWTKDKQFKKWYLSQIKLKKSKFTELENNFMGVQEEMQNK